MRCLVTGVAGFIGSHVAERLIGEGHEVVGVDCFADFYSRELKEANLESLRDFANFSLIEDDLATMALPPVLDGTDWIFHHAAHAGVRASWGHSFDRYVSGNISATHRLLEAAIQVSSLKRLVYASSSSVYGDAGAFAVTEQSPTHPTSPYGVSKLAAEHLCSAYWKSFQVPTVSLRYFSVYGPRQRPDMAFHRFGRALLTTAPITVFGDATQTRDFTYVADVVDANMRAAETPGVEGEVFNIAGGSRVVLRHVIAQMEELLGRRTHIAFHESARGDVHDTCGDIAHANRLLGYAPRTPFREGLARELEYLDTLYGDRQLASVSRDGRTRTAL